MRVAVRYYTRSGNTARLAKAIAERAGVPAYDVTCDLKEKVDLLFLGCSYYAFDVDENVKAFIMRNSGLIGRIVCFGTSAMMKSVHKPMQKVAGTAGVLLHNEEFHCRGSFGPMHKGRPDAEDLGRAAAFAGKIIDTME